MPLAAATIHITNEVRARLLQDFDRDQLPRSASFVVPRVAGQPTGLQGKADKGWSTYIHSKIVRARGGCERCGTGKYLEAAHIVTRSVNILRCDDRNLICLCRSCHLFMTENPILFESFIVKLYGHDRSSELTRIWSRGDKLPPDFWLTTKNALRIRAALEGIDL